MAWATTLTGTQLALTGTYQVVQRSAADWVTVLAPAELAVVEVDFDYTIVTTDDAAWIDIIIQESIDDDADAPSTASKSRRYVYSSVDDPDVTPIRVTGIRSFQVSARLRDNDDSVWSGDDTCTLDVRVRQDGVSA